jgi:hypothetical protein
MLFPAILYFQQRPVIGSFFTISYPLHFGGQLEFAVRGISGALYILMIYLLHTRRLSLVLIILLVSFWVHPNTALSVAVVILPALVVLGIANKMLFWKTILGFMLVVGIGIAPLLLKAKGIDSFAVEVISVREWQINMIMGEGVNYSAIYYISYHTVGQIVALILPMLVALMLYRRGAGYHDDQIWILLLVTPVVVWMLVLSVELLTEFDHAKWIIRLLAPGQFGLKVVELSYVPMLFSIAILASRRNLKRLDRIKGDLED